MDNSISSLNHVIENKERTFPDKMFHLWITLPHEDPTILPLEGPYRIRRVDVTFLDLHFSMTIELQHLEDGVRRTIARLRDNPSKWMTVCPNPLTGYLSYSERELPFEVRHKLNFDCLSGLEEPNEDDSPAP